ncbi:hypothetical protein GCM10028784_09560 [Myceligenerans cantabricum]
MRLSRVWIVPIVGLAVLSACGSLGDGVDRHRDDEVHGALSVMPGSGGATLEVPGYVKKGEEWDGIFGSHIPCLNDEAVPVTITGIRWKVDDETRPVSVTPYSRVFDSREAPPIGSARGNMSDPEFPEDLKSLEMRKGVDEIEVTRPCGDDSTPWKKGIENEILFVIRSGPEGAGIRNVTVSYTTPDGKKHESVSHWRFYLCGSNVPKKYGCD